MPDLCQDFKLWRLEWILLGEQKVALEESTFVQCIGRANNHNLPPKDIIIIDKTGREALYRVLV